VSKVRVYLGLSLGMIPDLLLKRDHDPFGSRRDRSCKFRGQTFRREVLLKNRLTPLDLWGLVPKSAKGLLCLRDAYTCTPGVLIVLLLA
jgi:hypothetical protein